MSTLQQRNDPRGVPNKKLQRRHFNDRQELNILQYKQRSAADYWKAAFRYFNSDPSLTFRLHKSLGGGKERGRTSFLDTDFNGSSDTQYVQFNEQWKRALVRCSFLSIRELCAWRSAWKKVNFSSMMEQQKFRLIKFALRELVGVKGKCFCSEPFETMVLHGMFYFENLSARDSILNTICIFWCVYRM